MEKRFSTGDPVIYVVSKASTKPGPRAHDVSPAQHGDNYTYAVDKFWRVKAIEPDGRLRLVTRRGKEHLCDPQDRRLRKPGLIARWWYRQRFPDPALVPESR